MFYDGLKFSIFLVNFLLIFRRYFGTIYLIVNKAKNEYFELTENFLLTRFSLKALMDIAVNNKCQTKFKAKLHHRCLADS